MRPAPDPRHSRAVIMGAVGRLLREFWVQEEAEPVPEEITRLIDRLDGSRSGEERGGGAAASPGSSNH